MQDFIDMAQTTDDGSPTYDLFSPENQLIQSSLDEANELLGLDQPSFSGDEYTTQFDKQLLALIDAVALG